MGYNGGYNYGGGAGHYTRGTLDHPVISLRQQMTGCRVSSDYLSWLPSRRAQYLSTDEILKQPFLADSCTVMLVPHRELSVVVACEQPKHDVSLLR